MKLSQRRAGDANARRRGERPAAGVDFRRLRNWEPRIATPERSVVEAAGETVHPLGEKKRRPASPAIASSLATRAGIIHQIAAMRDKFRAEMRRAITKCRHELQDIAAVCRGSFSDLGKPGSNTALCPGSAYAE
jgi:hypothetical protein